MPETPDWTIVCPRCGSTHPLINTADGTLYVDDYKLYTCQECYHRFNHPTDTTEPLEVADA